MKKKYDIIVIGAGSGGLNIAVFMQKAGFKVLLIDKSDKSIGGDCLNFGCVPSKALIHTSRIVHAASKSKEFGLSIKGEVNLKRIERYIHSKKEVIRKHENATHFRKMGMDVILGHAKFVSKDEITVNEEVYQGKKIVIATGSSPRKLEIPGIENVRYHTNETIFQETNLPKQMITIGGGPIGIELGQAYQRLGAQVTVVHRGKQCLPKEDSDISKGLKEQLASEGMRIILESEPVKCVGTNKLVIRAKDGSQKTLPFDSLLVSIGRTLNINSLDLDKAGIKTENKKLVLNDYLQTTNKRVYAIGDVVGSYQFTHAAELHAGIILTNFFSPFKKKVNYDNLSWVTYTQPEVATFGLQEPTLKERNIDYKVLDYSFDEDDRAIVDGATYGRLKLFVSKNKLLGGTMLAENAGELIQELILANSVGLSIKTLFNKVYPYPTASRTNKRAIQLHFLNKLNPFSKKILKLFYH
ncbi:mercuric reductase [archaeon]|nr:mercuric reductase [archaeon]